MKIVWSPEAIEDATSAWSFVAPSNMTAADRLLENIEKSAASLSALPRRGRPGRAPGTRELVLQKGPFVIVYRESAARVEILRVMHGARDWPARD